MTPTATIPVTIGGQAIELPNILTFDVLERAWPAVKALADAKTTIEQTAAGLAMVSAVIITTRPELNVVELKKRLRINELAGGDERPGLMDACNQLMRQSGLVPKAGEAAPPGEGQDQAATETGPLTSTISSPS